MRCASGFTFRCRLASIAAVLATAFVARAETELVGQIVDRVSCDADPTQGYALYVPKDYNPEKKWPVIFCFDASARGRMPVERLQGGAEKYGYIVAGSLNSKNGRWTENTRAMQAMVRDVSAHLSIDPRRVYTAGVSGGARVAMAVALSGIAKGVIACAAGFPQTDAEIPRTIPFAIFGTTGTEDFNYAEMKLLDDELDGRKSAHRIVVFEGGHTWASADLMTEALEWLRLQAMRAGAEPKDDAFIQSQFQTRVAKIQLLVGLERWREVRSLVSDFEALCDVADFSREEKKLGTSRETMRAVATERALARREVDLLEKLGNGPASDDGSSRVLARELQLKSESAAATPERQMTRRVIAAYFSIARQTVTDLFPKKEFEQAAALLEVAAILRPHDSRTHWDLARAYAYEKDRKRALAALRQAISNGLYDSVRVEAEPAFETMKNDPEFRKAIAAFRSNSADVVQLPVMQISAALRSVEARQFYLPNAGGEVSVLSFLRIESVPRGSAAAGAGVVVGLEITAIQGTRIRGLSEDELSRLMSRPVKNEVLLTVREAHRTPERELRIPLRKSSLPSPAR